ncbi:type II toxin-antitoxin system CcdA family antitoxin [Skermanella rosea]|nr:type II toxin-antitoxin system CcdA family antitoxin [Skermanella rosea]
MPCFNEDLLAMGRDYDIDISVEIEAGIAPAVAQEAARRRQQDIDSDIAVLNRHRSIHGLLLDEDELLF